MKTAIYIEDGTVQLVITPESEFEKNAIDAFKGKEMAVKIFTGAFYDCRGGWIRQKKVCDPMDDHFGRIYRLSSEAEDSLIFRITETLPAAPGS